MRRLALSFFGAGFIRPAPGTWGSLAALPAGLLLHLVGGPILIAVGAAALYVIGVHLTRQENLWALPIGSARGLDPEDLSHNKLILLIDALRNRFDAIVLDTGPILTSVEAALATAVSDRTIMVVRRDQKAEFIRSSVARLSQLGASCLGIVFNKATAADLKHRESSAPIQTARAAPFVPADPARAAGSIRPQARAVDEGVKTDSPRKQAA